MDGFPIFGPRGPGGVMMKQCTEPTSDPTFCVDQCGGYYGDLGDGYLYRYYTMGAYNDGNTCENDLWYTHEVGQVQTCEKHAEWQSTYYPFTPLCLHGCCPEGLLCDPMVPPCNSDATPGTSNDFQTDFVQGMYIYLLTYFFQI